MLRPEANGAELHDAWQWLWLVAIVMSPRDFANPSPTCPLTKAQTRRAAHGDLHNLSSALNADSELAPVCPYRPILCQSGSQRT
jgi:hypothetical protein